MLTCISKVLIFTGYDHKLEYLPYITISDITLFIDLFRYVATSQFNKLTYLLTNLLYQPSIIMSIAVCMQIITFG